MDNCSDAIGRLLIHPLEIQLVKKIDELPHVVNEVISGLSPHLLNRYLITACQLFNTYYNDVNVSRSEDDIKSARVYLLHQFGKTLEKVMELLGMKSVERM
jgi:arginyl-tRNA synthetase